MNSEIKQINAELNKMQNEDVVAFEFDPDTNLPSDIEDLFNNTNTFCLDYGGKRFQYLTVKQGVSKSSLKQFMESQNWGTFHTDGEAHLDSVRADIKNKQRRARRMGLR